MANDPTIKINADASGVVKGVQVAQGALGKLQRQMTELEALSAKGLSFSGVAGLGLSATAAAAGVIALTKAAADYGDRLDNMSQRTGIAVEDLSKLAFAAKMSDTSNEALQKGLTFLSGSIFAAANGAKESAVQFEKYGIAVRDSVSGEVRSAYDVLVDIADLFATMPDGTEKTALAVEFFGKKLGAELIPLLNQGKEGLKALGDEAERLGLVMNSSQAKAAAEFNDNLDRLAALSGAAGRSIGNALIPSINNLMQKLLLARDNKLSVWQILFDVLPEQSALGDPITIADKIKKVTAELESFKRVASDSKAQKMAGWSSGDIDKEIADRERLLAYLQAMQKKQTVDDSYTAAQRATLALTLSRKLEELEKFRAVAAGKASAEILKSDKDLNDARIKDGEKLRDALRAAYQQTVSDAQKAGDEAKRLFDEAAKKRRSGADKAFDASTAGMSEEERAAAYGSQAQEMFGQGNYYAAAANAARLDGRLKDVEKYAKLAEDYLARAEQFADKSGDASLIEDIGKAQATQLEAQAKAKQAEADALGERANAQMQTLNAVEAQLTKLQQAAANFEIKANVQQLESEVARIRADLAKGAVMPITTSGGTAPQVLDLSSYGPGYWGGGWTGPGGKYQPAGIVHAGEWVHPQEVVRQPGAMAFLALFDRLGMSALKGYANGGLVSRMSMPTLNSAAGSAVSSAAGRNLTLVLDGQSFGVNADGDVLDRLGSFAAKQARKRGGRS